MRRRTLGKETCLSTNSAKRWLKASILASPSGKSCRSAASLKATSASGSCGSAMVALLVLARLLDSPAQQSSVEII